MKSGPVQLLMVLALLIGLPVLGVWLGGKPVHLYMDFPPRTGHVEHAPFSWPVFFTLLIFVVVVIWPFLSRLRSSHRRHSARAPEPSPAFPWWGWAGLGWTGVMWIVAWNRFDWMSSLQQHTFAPLWIGYIVSVNAWTVKRSGCCLLLHRPRAFAALFPLSAGFWWFFEYLNRFTQNWVYVGVGELAAWEYLIEATIPFSTVLPAVVSTQELLATFPHLSAGLDRFRPVRIRHKTHLAWLAVSAAGLFGLGIWPNALFPLVWIAPLLILLSLQGLVGRPTILAPLELGDWRGLWTAALAALVCGFFWELWNWGSLAHWEYAIPYVHRFQLFAMPVLGYAGYLPFGLECMAIANLVLNADEFRPTKDAQYRGIRRALGSIVPAAFLAACLADGTRAASALDHTTSHPPEGHHEIMDY